MSLEEFKLHYHISNNGDGSASVHLHKTAHEAKIADRDMDEGWGEPCNGYVQLKLEDGKLYYKTYEFVNHEFSDFWVEMEVSK